MYLTRDEREWAQAQRREERKFLDDLFAEEESQKIIEWRIGSTFISMHFDPERNEIYFKDIYARQGSPFLVKHLRRPTEAEKKARPDLYAVLDNGEWRVGLTSERYMTLRAKLEENQCNLGR